MNWRLSAISWARYAAARIGSCWTPDDRTASASSDEPRRKPQGPLSVVRGKEIGTDPGLALGGSEPDGVEKADRALRDRQHRPLDPPVDNPLGGHLVEEVPGQVVDPKGRNREGEIVEGDLLYVMRLVQHDRLPPGDHARHPPLANHQVDKKEVVIDHHDIGGLRPSPGAAHETVVETGAFRPEAPLRGRGYLPPEGELRGKIGKLRPIAGLRRPRPPLDLARERCPFSKHKAVLTPEPLVPAQAEVVAAPLEYHRLDGPVHRPFDDGDVLLDDLFLEVDGPRGDDGLLAREERGHQVGKGLTRPRARLHHEGPPLGKRPPHGPGHDELAFPKLEPGKHRRETPVLAEKLVYLCFVIVACSHR